MARFIIDADDTEMHETVICRLHTIIMQIFYLVKALGFPSLLRVLTRVEMFFNFLQIEKESCKYKIKIVQYF